MENQNENPYRDPAFKTPWVVTDEIWERNGYWSDFVAWEQWMGSLLRDEAADEFSELDSVLKANLYAATVKACRVAAGVESDPAAKPQITVTLVGPAPGVEYCTVIEGEVVIPPGSVDVP